MTSAVWIAAARSRLVQFLAIGAVLFWLTPRARDDRRIELAHHTFDTLQAAEAARRGGLDANKSAEVTARAIEDEMLYREGVRLGLDQDDPLIRQRVIQKALLLAEELGGANREPTRAELVAVYDRDRERYRRPPRYHLVHVFASRRDALPAALPDTGLPAAGEPFPLPRETTATRDELARTYGDGFASAVVARATAPSWSAPVQSTYGWHRIRVVEVIPSQIPPLDEIASRVAFDAIVEARERVMRRYLDEVAARYDVFVDGERVPFTPTLRLARRDDSSAED